MNSSILVTGGAGYIGSHSTLALLQAGYDVVVIDNLSNSSYESLQRVADIAGRSATFVHGDVRDAKLLYNVLLSHRVFAVLHFAGLKAVGESVENPLHYYDNNVNGSLTLILAMAKAGVFRLVFSSSATVYGEPDIVPISETTRTGPTSPYGRSKLMIEELLRDVANSDPRWRIGVLRYFNPVGAHDSGLIGEDPNGIPNNLLPFISQVAVGRLPELAVFGNDYPTPDGTGVRDYIHVVDLANGHLKALTGLDLQNTGWNVWNLGTGRGYSVLEIIQAFEAASGRKIPYRVKPRRSGDIAICWSDPRKAQRELGWQAERGLTKMMEDTWRWQSMNQNGYTKL